MLVGFKEQQQLDDARVVDAAHDLNLFEDIGTLLVSVPIGKRGGESGASRPSSRPRPGRGMDIVQPKEPTKACTRILSSLEGQRLQVGWEGKER